ncbi:MAG: DUF3122 domain-containing protein [Synechococcus sp.]
MLPQLRPEVPLKLTVPTLDGSAVEMSVPASTMQEWQDVASRG